MACTFDSPCLTSAVNGLQPTFGFSANSTNYFGIGASFTNGKFAHFEIQLNTEDD